jgi:hypothetical protein
MRIFALAMIPFALLTIAVQAEAAAKRESRYTDISGKRCSSGGEGVFSCPGEDGWRIDIADEGNIIQIRVAHAGAGGEPLELTGRGLGEKAEWRGVRLRKGFRADALIVRMRPGEDDLLDSSLLFIVKLNAGGACFSGLVDARANANANRLVRAAADKLTDICDPYPQVYGKRTAATDAFGS